MFVRVLIDLPELGIIKGSVIYVEPWFINASMVVVKASQCLILSKNYEVI